MAVTTIPESHMHAERLLRAQRVQVREIVRVYPDAILYIDGDGVAMTAWLYARSGPPGSYIDFSYDAGFAAEPSDQ